MYIKGNTKKDVSDFYSKDTKSADIIIKNQSVRVRFAPAPTGTMHLGNIRTALMNFLFAHQQNGFFLVRIEDTDQARELDPSAQGILKDLDWLQLSYDEGPEIGGPYAPYFQSKRTEIYQKHLDELKEKKQIYRCFCSETELEQKKARQVALKLPPRYDRTCARLSEQEITKRLELRDPYLWRILLIHESISIQDLSRGTIQFDLKNFSDFALTRQDGSFTFMFANFVDDMVMKITHVFRGEDHLSNTAGQAALYQAFKAPLPIFWHMPILTNLEGKKLSKRDFAFSVKDLKEEGYLPEAVLNYLAILGGSYAQEIMNSSELIEQINFKDPHTAGQIKYDVEKLNWINKHWIMKLDIHRLVELSIPYLETAYPEVVNVPQEKLHQIINLVKPDLYRLSQLVTALKFYFIPPTLLKTDFEACLDEEIIPLVYQLIAPISKEHLSKDYFIEGIKKEALAHKIPTKQLFWFLRLALMGTTHGPSIPDLIRILGPQSSFDRISYALTLLKKSI